MTKILLVGATGNLGSIFAEVAKQENIDLRVLVRPESLKDDAKASLVSGFEVVQGSLHNYDNLLEATKGVDVVISTITQFADQLNLIKAAKENNVKRFVPSEFGFKLDPEVVYYSDKKPVRDAVVASGLEWTSIQSNCFAEWFLPGLFGAKAAFPEAVELYNEGKGRIAVTALADIARITFRTVTDPRAANKNVVLAFPQNVHTQAEYVSLWESVSGETVKRIPVSRQDIDARIASAKAEERWVDAFLGQLVLNHSFQGLGEGNVGEGDVAGHELYPDFKPITVEQFFFTQVVNKKVSQTKYLLIGATGHLGVHFAEVAKKDNLNVRALMRPDSLKDEAKAKIVAGLEIAEGSTNDYASLVEALKGVDVVISTLGASQIADQANLVKAAQEAGVKRFVPSEFGFRGSEVTVFNDSKSVIRQAVIDAKLEWTAIQTNCFSEWFAPGLLNMLKGPYLESVEVYGDGNAKVAFSALEDVARITFRASVDPRTANKNISIAFPDSVFSQNEAIALWEKLSGTTLKRVPVTAEELATRIESGFKENRILDAITAIINRNTNIDHVAVTGNGDLEAHGLYSDLNSRHTSLSKFLKKLVKQ